MDQSNAELRARAAELEAMTSRLRHDLRSALAPAMLAADMLRTNADPKVQRSAGTVVRAIERVLDTLDATRELVPPRSGPVLTQAGVAKAPPPRT